jgi:hypothetical protein
MTYFSLLPFKGVCLGTSGLYISCFNKINSPITYSFSVALFPCYSPVIFISRWVVSMFFIL